MSLAYWVIQGIGIDVDKLASYFDKEKMARFIFDQMSDDEELAEIVEYGWYDNFDIENYLHGYPFDNIADVFTYCDDTDTLTYGDDGEGHYYLYYPPSMPWELTKQDPQTISDVHRNLIAAVQKIANISAVEIETFIDDDLYVVGCG